MKRLLFLVPALFLLMSFEWPAPPAGVSTVFLQRTDKGFSPGLVVTVSGLAVNSPEAGELVFLAEIQADMRRSLPGGLPTFVALQHENGVRSILAGPRPDDRLRFKARLNAGERLGELPGAGTPLRIFFQTPDGAIANPMNYLPAFPDTRAPEIRDVVAVNERGETLSFLRRSSVPAGFYQVGLVLVDLWSLPDGRNAPRGISSWGVTIDAKEERSWSLSGAMWGAGGPMAKAGTPVGNWVLEGNTYTLERIFVNVGLNTFALRAVDAAGVVSERTIRVYGLRP